MQYALNDFEHSLDHMILSVCLLVKNRSFKYYFAAKVFLLENFKLVTRWGQTCSYGSSRVDRIHEHPHWISELKFFKLDTSQEYFKRNEE